MYVVADVLFGVKQLKKRTQPRSTPVYTYIIITYTVSTVWPKVIAVHLYIIILHYLLLL